MCHRDLERRGILLGVVWVTFGAIGLALSGCGTGVNVPGAASTSTPAAVYNGPQLGYLWDTADQTLRPLLGVPGSSQFGQPLTAAGAYANGAASVRSATALLQAANGTISSMSLPDGAPQVIAGASLSGNVQIVFSPGGLNAVVYVPGASSAMLLTGLNGTAKAQMLSPANSLIAATVSDTAQVAAAYGSGPVSVVLLTGGTGTISSLSGFGGFSFLPGGSDLLMADSTSGVVTLVRNATSAPAAQTFMSSLIQGPLAVAGSADGKLAVVANGADASVVRIDLTGATVPQRIACACQPAQLYPLMGNAVFSLTVPGSSTSATPGWVVDASAAVPRTVFIPAVQR